MERACQFIDVVLSLANALQRDGSGRTISAVGSVYDRALLAVESDKLVVIDPGLGMYWVKLQLFNGAKEGWCQL